ncbi:TPA: hypothetical protein I9082_002943 [Clostridium perfringens]|nr:hypothetical protein [Clostridium perfringens]
MDLELYYRELSKLFPNGVDIIPEDFKFESGAIAKEFKVGESTLELKNTHLEHISLQIRLVGLNENKFEIIKEANKMDKKINDTRFSNGDWITREDIWNTNYIDEDKFNFILMYNIKKYK